MQSLNLGAVNCQSAGFLYKACSGLRELSLNLPWAADQLSIGRPHCGPHYATKLKKHTCLFVKFCTKQKKSPKEDQYNAEDDAFYGTSSSSAGKMASGKPETVRSTRTRARTWVPSQSVSQSRSGHRQGRTCVAKRPRVVETIRCRVHLQWNPLNVTILYKNR